MNAEKNLSLKYFKIKLDLPDCWISNMEKTGNSSRFIEAIFFNPQPKVLEIPEGNYDVVFIPEINDFNNKQRLQLKVKDLAPTNLEL